MKRQTLCLSILIVAFLFVADIPRVHGTSSNDGWLGLAENELLDLTRSIINSVNDILQERHTPQMIEEKIDEGKLPGKDRENNSQETATTDENKKTDNSAEKNVTESGAKTDEDKVTDNSAEKNTSEGGDSPRETKELSENRLPTVINVENLLKSLTKNLKECELQRSKSKNESNIKIVCHW